MRIKELVVSKLKDYQIYLNKLIKEDAEQEVIEQTEDTIEELEKTLEEIS